MEFHAEVETDIRRPVPEVFEYLANAENFPRWAREFEAVDKLSDGPVGQGSLFLIRLKAHRTVVDVILGRDGNTNEPLETTVEWTEYDAPHKVSWDGTPIRRPPGNVTVKPRGSFIIEERNGGAHIRAVYEPDLDGVPKPLVPVLSWFLRKGRSKDFRRLKALLEAGGTTAGSS